MWRMRGTTGGGSYALQKGRGWSNNAIMGDRGRGHSARSEAKGGVGNDPHRDCAGNTHRRSA